MNLSHDPEDLRLQRVLETVEDLTRVGNFLQHFLRGFEADTMKRLDAITERLERLERAQRPARHLDDPAPPAAPSPTTEGPRRRHGTIPISVRLEKALAGVPAIPLEQFPKAETRPLPPWAKSKATPGMTYLEALKSMDMVGFLCWKLGKVIEEEQTRDWSRWTGRYRADHWVLVWALQHRETLLGPRARTEP